MAKNVFGLIYAGENNMNLRDLVYMRALGALPLGGKYRAIDFALSNMVNTGIRNIGVITQKNYHSLMDHLGSGKEWDLSRKNDGLFVLPPFDTYQNTGQYRGYVDAIKNVMAYVRRAKQQYCLLTGSYTICNTTYDELIHEHMSSGADITLLYNVLPNLEPEDNMFKDIRLEVDETGRVIDMEINSHAPKYLKAGMDIYLMRKDLLEYLVEEASARGKSSLVRDVLIANLNRLNIRGVEHKGYVGRLHNVASYFQMNMDFLKEDVQKELFYTENPILTKIKDEVPAKYGSSAKVSNSLVANGCIIEGTVENSILFRGVRVEPGSVIKNSIVMQDSEVYQNSYLENVILDKQVHIRTGKRLIGSDGFPVIIRKGAVV